MMLPPSALRSMTVMFATPCYISNVSMNFTTSMFSLSAACASAGLSATLHMHSESLITRGRNFLVKEFLRNESFTHLFWIDSDIGFSPDAVFRLLLADRDVAVGVYPLKTLIWPDEGLPKGMTRAEHEVCFTTYAFNPIGHGREPLRPYLDEDGFLEIAEASTGFMAIKRSVFLDLMKTYPELNYVPDGHGGRNHPDAHLYWRFFDCIIDPESGRYLSEDYGFCRRWRDRGGKIYADIHSKLSHLGQHSFSGDFNASMRAQGHLKDEAHGRSSDSPLS